MSNWVASVALLCPAAHRASAALTACALSGNAADAAPEFFSRPVGPPGAQEPTHYLAHSRIRDVALAALPQLEEQYPGALWVITEHSGDSLEQPVIRPSVFMWLESLNLTFLDTEEADHESA